MTDDIVTRLRDRAEERQEALDEYWRGHKFDYDFPMLESQAADEIERLRALIAHGLTDAYDCEGCAMCEQLKALHLEAMRNVV